MEELLCSNPCCVKTQELSQAQCRIAFLEVQLSAALAAMSNLRLADAPPSQSRLQSLPQELLDQIASYMDSKSILPLCHAVPSLKHISKAIFDVGATFIMPIDWLWPEFQLPVQFHDVPDQLGIKRLPLSPLGLTSARNRWKVETLLNLITQYDGVAKVQIHSFEYFDSIVDLLPNTIDLCIAGSVNDSAFLTYKGQDPYESVLRLFCIQNPPRKRLKIRRLDVPCFFFGTDYLQHENVVDIAKRVQILRIFGISENNVLQILDFPQLQQLELDADQETSHEKIHECLTLVTRHGSLKRVTFEYFTLEEEETRRKVLESIMWKFDLEKIGWMCFESVGPIYKNPCVVWERKK
ncbi:UNVERIFIED_CONTAM: hypothetical protein HDU68_001835 [Siphonaria sp. JEL0065]|nr:hypothetical protein HDU68_001835 [Siphonaria sp. JEL0065]